MVTWSRMAGIEMNKRGHIGALFKMSTNIKKENLLLELMKSAGHKGKDVQYSFQIENFVNCTSKTLSCLHLG